MPELIAKPALSGKSPLTRLATTLSEMPWCRVTSVALFPGKEKAAVKALKPLGFGFPAPNEALVAGEAALLWTGREQAFLLGAAAPAGLEGAAALTDQSDGWAQFLLEGPASAEVLARYVPLDLRLAAFEVNRVVRAPVYHMSAVIHRVSETGFRVMVFRSMAQTAWHELAVALDTLAARAARA